jgi:hypothetical protein
MDAAVLSAFRVCLGPLVEGDRFGPEHVAKRLYVGRNGQPPRKPHHVVPLTIGGVSSQAFPVDGVFRMMRVGMAEYLDAA